ncbi:MAG: N-acetyl-gamma-glutamyl-phosphate reductase [Bacillota bacterium]
MIRAGIIGATGYTGIELIRYLKLHSKVKLVHLISRSKAGKKLSKIYPNFLPDDFILEKYDPENLQDTDIVFTALPHGVSQDIVAEIYEKGIKVIDLSGDFRYSDQERYERWYNIEHKYPHLLEKRVYGLAEMNQEKIKTADLVANPGCYPTASTLGLLPVINREFIDRTSIIVDAKSGVSGAGKSLKKVTHFIEANESIKAYGVTTHRHTSEIEANLEYFINESNINISFTPHLIPMKRGILSTIYVNLKENKFETEDLINIYRKFYEDSFFIKIKEETPDTKYVTGTNFCHISVNLDKRSSRLIITSVIDNLGKGAAGQAVQNMNLMFGLNETRGMKSSAIFP